MQLLKQQGATCTVTALAMILDMSVADVIDDLGKDGSHGHEVHIQDIQDWLLSSGRCLAEVEYCPAWSSGPCYDLEYRASRFANLIHLRRGLIYALSQGGAERHMLAWDGTKLADPATGAYISHSNYPTIYSAYLLGNL